jgi:N-[(2S)-2-amino-2-carboxyethyl]-L-glutamate dehydrogenase
MSDLLVVPGAAVSEILAGGNARIAEIVTAAYLAHHRGHTVNPASLFLRFPDRPEARVIALPAYVAGEAALLGMKWIASFPDNLRHGLPRASAVLILNDHRTGRPVACLDAAEISAARTAASAVLVADRLSTHVPGGHSVTFVGAGRIAHTILDHLADSPMPLAGVRCHDLDPDRAQKLAEYAHRRVGVPVVVDDTLTASLDAGVVVFATTAGTPHVPVETTLRPGQLLLNISLRDLPPEILLRSNNIVDDVDHCLTARTSPHLAEQLTGSRDFITGTIGDVLTGVATLDASLPTVVSPFGLGVLDVAVGGYVLDEAVRRGTAITIDGFLGRAGRP